MYKEIKKFFEENDVSKYLNFNDDSKTIVGLNGCISLNVGYFNRIQINLKIGSKEVSGDIYWNGSSFVDAYIEPMIITIFDLIDTEIPNPHILEVMNLHIISIDFSN